MLRDAAAKLRPMITDAAAVTTTDIQRYAWSGLRRFHHVPSVTERIIREKRVPKTHHRNARKQAEQIRHCLLQAAEYKEAASTVSYATRPLLLYYSIMSLALAQILIKGNGTDSLDAARGKHAHHGLDFKQDSYKSDSYDLRTAASALRAEPLMNGSERRGTFELWHRYCHEEPLIGKCTTVLELGTSVDPASILFVASGNRMGFLPKEGLSFFDCLQGCPGLYYNFLDWGLHTNIVRGTISRVIRPEYIMTEITVHPHTNNARMLQLQNDFLFAAGSHERIQAHDYGSGFRLSITDPTGEHTAGWIPNAVSWTNEDLRFLPHNTPLNEFGYLYVGLFILGNYARYFPDRWIPDVEAGTPLALAAESFIAIAEERMALLTLSELSGVYYIYGR